MPLILGGLLLLILVIGAPVGVAVGLASWLLGGLVRRRGTRPARVHTT